MQVVISPEEFQKVVRHPFVGKEERAQGRVESLNGTGGPMMTLLQ